MRKRERAVIAHHEAGYALGLPSIGNLRLDEEVVRALSDALGRACGACSLCCKLLQIDEPELKKSANEWCRHCRPGKGGCAIYDERPPVCRDFACEWLINPKVGDEWQPLRSKIVIYITEEGGEFFLVFVVDPGIPNRWREASYYQSIKAAALSGLRSETGTYLQTLVVIGERRWLILPHRDVEITSRWYKVVPIGDDQWEVLIFNDEEHGRRVLAAVDQYVETLDARADSGGSANPGGRPKDPPIPPGYAPDPTVADRRPISSLVVEARRYSALAVDTLVELTKDNHADSTRYAAATALLDRGYGRPAQSLDLHLSADAITKRLSDMTDAELAALEQRMIAAAPIVLEATAGVSDGAGELSDGDTDAAQDGECVGDEPPDAPA